MENDDYDFRFHPQNVLMMLLLAGLTALFLAFSAAYIYSRVQNQSPPVAIPYLFVFNTLLLFGSGYTLKRAKICYLEDNTAGYQRSLLLTIIITSLFLMMQLIACGDVPATVEVVSLVISGQGQQQATLRSSRRRQIALRTDRSICGSISLALLRNHLGTTTLLQDLQGTRRCCRRIVVKYTAVTTALQGMTTLMRLRGMRQSVLGIVGLRCLCER